MFDIGKVLKRSWQILWDYKVLWIFGFLLALTGGSGGSSAGSRGSNFSTRFNQQMHNGGSTGNPFAGFENQTWFQDLNRWFTLNFGRFFDTQAHMIQFAIWAVVIVIAIGLLIGLILAFVRYPAMTAIIRMTDDHEKTGSKLNFKTGWSLGWNRRSFRIWLITFIIKLPMALITLGFVAVIGVNVYNVIMSSGNTVALSAMIGTLVVAGLLFLPFVLLFLLVDIWRQVVIRFAAIEDTSVGESFAKGWGFFKAHFKYVLLIWLVLIGISIAAGIAMIVVAFILIPTYVIMAIPGAIVAAVTGAVGYGITALFAPHIWPWIIGGLVALPFFFAVTLSPITFISGWVEIFTSNVWTLTFRELKAMEAVPPALDIPVQTPPAPPVM
jgi:hypothetical protein